MATIDRISIIYIFAITFITEGVYFILYSFLFCIIGFYDSFLFSQWMVFISLLQLLWLKEFHDWIYGGKFFFRFAEFSRFFLHSFERKNWTKIWLLWVTTPENQFFCWKLFFTNSLQLNFKWIKFCTSTEQNMCVFNHSNELSGKYFCKTLTRSSLLHSSKLILCKV